MKYTFIRFLMVGILNTVIGLSTTYIFLHAVHFSYWLATFLGNAIGAVCSYIMNRTFTFKSQSAVGKSMLRFVVVIVGCYVLSYAVGKNAVEWLLSTSSFSDSFKTDIAVLVSAGLYTILNYFMQKIFVFK